MGQASCMLFRGVLHTGIGADQLNRGMGSILAGECMSCKVSSAGLGG